uniref:ABC transporter domain-containing protein n=1 Tax=Lotharella globosa TaxID=91324 RepID=A0A7S3YX25_9EUKA
MTDVELKQPDTAALKSVNDEQTLKTIDSVAPLHNPASVPGDAAAAGGVDITFTDLTYTVPLPDKKELQILKNLNGQFKSGKLTALMGPSGSGKTTLLDVLAGRKNVGKIDGEIRYGGHVGTQMVFKKLTSYVEQFDTLVPDLTVRQFLMYTASLKLPASTTGQEKEEIVDSVIQKLSLDVCKDTVIGNELQRGISGGQAKRTNIAMALLTKPQIVLLDEPTTGLDSHMANEVVIIMRALAAEGTTVIATIHSPTAFAFNLFDELYLLSSGEQIFDGPLSNQAKPMLDHFKSLGFSPSPTDSVVEWMVELISGRKLKTPETVDAKDHKAALADEEKEGDGFNFAQGWQESDTCKTKTALIREAHEQLKGTPAAFNPHEGVVANSMCHGVGVLFKYRSLTHYQNPEFIGPRFGDKFLFSLLILSLYWGTGNKTNIQDMQSTASMLYFVVAILAYGAAGFIPSISLDRPLFYRERNDGLYTTATYFLAKFMEEAIVCVFTSLIFTVIVWWSVDFQGSFGVFIFTYYLVSMTGIVLAYFIAAIVPTMEAASALLPTYVTFCMFFGGLFIVFDKIPPGWQWFSWLTFIRYPWTAMMLNQFDHPKFTSQKVFDGRDILDFYGMDSGFTNNLWLNVLVLAGFMVFFSLCSLMGLAFIRHDSR